MTATGSRKGAAGDGIGSAALERVKALLAQLPGYERAQLVRFLADIDESEAAPPAHVAMTAMRVASPDPGTRREDGPARGAVLRRVWVRCAKPSCRCRKDPGSRHGPYLYHYWWEDGKTRKSYAGKA
ncbi:MAG: DUF6788 family protein [Thermoplasmatota archaeon]